LPEVLIVLPDYPDEHTARVHRAKEIYAMYSQIKPTEMFRERHLALQTEAQERRLGRQLRAGAGRQTKARSTVAVSTLGLLAALLAAGLLVLFAFSVPALGKQSASEKTVSGSSKNDAGLATTSSTTTPKASFASGSGANFLGVKISDHGNLLSFESPQGQENVFSDAEGYAVCSDNDFSERTVNGHDTGSIETGFGTPTFSQPNGTGTFPLTVTRKTTDGKFQLTQVWNKPDATEKDVTVAMTLKNISGATSNGVALSRSGDFDVGTSSLDQGATTADSTWQWDDVGSSADSSQVGTMLTALTFGTAHLSRAESRSDWVATGGTRTGCFARNLATPTSVQDLAMRVTYELGFFTAGQSKTVKFEYGRM
jgi:hypothetical protein